MRLEKLFCTCVLVSEACTIVVGRAIKVETFIKRVNNEPNDPDALFIVSLPCKEVVVIILKARIELIVHPKEDQSLVAECLEQVWRQRGVTEAINRESYIWEFAEGLIDELETRVEHVDNTLIIRKGLIMLHHSSMLEGDDPSLNEILHILFHLDCGFCVPPLDKEGEVRPEEFLMVKRV